MGAPSEPVGVVHRQDGQGVCAFHHAQGHHDRFGQGDILFLLDAFDQVHQHFGVGFALEGETFLYQLFFQTEVILDDAVVYQRHGTVLGDVRVGVLLVGLAMGCPAGVCDASRAARVPAGTILVQLVHAAFFLIHLDMVVLHQGNPRAVVSAVFQFTQTLDQNRVCVTIS